MRLRTSALVVAACLFAGGCGHGRVSGAAMAHAQADPAWMLVADVPFVPQKDEADCGAAALAMALGHGGHPTRVEDILAVAPADKDKGIFAGSLRNFARRQGFEAYLIAGTLADLKTEIGRGHPVLVGLVKTRGRTRISHYEVVVGVRRDEMRIMTMDPASGPREQAMTTFLSEWEGSARAALVVWRGR